MWTENLVRRMEWILCMSRQFEYVAADAKYNHLQTATIFQNCYALMSHSKCMQVKNPHGYLYSSDFSNSTESSSGTSINCKQCRLVYWKMCGTWNSFQVNYTVMSQTFKTRARGIGFNSLIASPLGINRSKLIRNNFK